MTAQPKSVFDSILEWSAGRPAWQRDALRRIIAKGKLNDADKAELVQLCLKGQGAEGITLEAAPLLATHVPAAAAAGSAITLTSVTDVAGVNRLAAGQTLPFAPTGITVIYGDNGVGKSGYARILKRACRARFVGDILPNAFDPAAPAVGSATIAYSDGAIPAMPIGWVNDGKPHPTLSAVSVFDRDCASVHVRNENVVAFRPFGLDVPDELAATCQALKEALTVEQTRLKSAQDPVFLTPTFSPDTPAGKILANLKATAKLAPLEAMVGLSEAEENRLSQLNEDLARDPLRAATEQRIAAQAMERFADSLAVTLAKTGDGPLLKLIGLGEDAAAKRAAAKLAAETAFGDAAIPGVGEKAWRVLWEAARRYSVEVAHPGQPFPPVQTDKHCVLCLQTLEESAIARMGAFERFVQADTEKVAGEAERDLHAALRDLEGTPIRISAFPMRGQLALQSKAAASAVLTALATARLRRCIALDGAGSTHKVTLPDQAPDPVPAVRQVAAQMLAYANDLAAATDPAGRKILTDERDGLRDRKALDVLLPKARTEVERLVQLGRIAKCITETTTNAVTKLGNDIADEVITPRMRDRFQKEIQQLAASRVRVDIVRSGGKYGSPQYQVRLFANDKAKVHSVLSEGEQTCVALAVFLAELATAGHSSCLVFDDPVSSLDHRWRRKVAERLADEAAVRQIVVFTHDLVFLNDLQTLARQRSVPIKEVSLTQTAIGAGVVHEGLPWAGQKIPERLDNLEKDARAARALFDAHDDEGYANAVANFYNRLRSTWERALEDRAFCNVVTRHRDYIDAKNLKRVTALTPADTASWAAGFKICCDITDAHDPSRGRNASPPPPDDLMKHVGELKAWDDSLRTRQAAIS